jgi:Glucose / Sorbosone dehydrogenase
MNRSCRVEQLMKSFTTALLLIATSASAAALPGFNVQLLGSTAGFADSIAIDSRGTIYYTATNGGIFRFEAGASVLVAQVTTDAVGNSGLLGMSLRDDHTAVVHYTTPEQTADVISSIDLVTGAETIIRPLPCDKDVPTRGTPSEHHGGNPTMASDGSIFVGIGDFANAYLAPDPAWNAGKIFRIRADGSFEQFARGLRNPFAMVWDAANQRLIAPDNGDAVNDKINIIHEGDYLGWPDPTGGVPPIYEFPVVVAPTGIIALSNHNPTLPRGYLLAGFVTKAIYYIPDIDARPLPDPIPLIQGLTGSIVALAQAPSGDIFFVTGDAVYKLVVPVGAWRTRAVRSGR